MTTTVRHCDGAEPVGAMKPEIFPFRSNLNSSQRHLRALITPVSYNLPSSELRKKRNATVASRKDFVHVLSATINFQSQYDPFINAIRNGNIVEVRGGFAEIAAAIQRLTRYT